MELETKENEQRIRDIETGGRRGNGNGSSSEKEATRANIAANALLLLEKGVPANVIGQYLIASESAHIPVNFGAGGGQQQGLTMQDVVQIFNLAKAEKGTSSELTTILNRLTDKVSELDAKINNPPATGNRKTWVIHPDGTKEEIEAGEPIVLKVPAPTNTSRSIDEVKEENRHKEKMEEIQTERDYKQKTTEFLSGLPSKIGAGLAGSLIDAEKPPEVPAGKGTTASVQYIKCETEGCGYSIPFAPTATKIICPKCRAIYERQTGEAKA